MQVEQVVAGHEDAGPGLQSLPCTVPGTRVAEFLDMPVVEQLHDAQVLPAAFQHHLQQRLEVEIHVRHRGKQRFFDERTDCFVGLAQPPRMIGVGRHAFQTIQQHLLQRLHVVVLAAYAGAHDTSAAVGCLFTLIAEHEIIPFVVDGKVRVLGRCLSIPALQ